MSPQQKTREMREERILLRLADFNFATRKQLQIAESLGGDRNAQRILRRMEKDRTLSVMRREQKIYYLSNRGKERIGSNQSKLERNKIEHTLMRNDLFIKLGMPPRWKKEVPIMKGSEILLIADAVYKNGSEYHFVEIDNAQTMRTNYDKIKKYKELSRILYKQNQRHLTLIWYSKSDIRKEKLRKACEKQRVKYKVY